MSDDNFNPDRLVTTPRTLGEVYEKEHAERELPPCPFHAPETNRPEMVGKWYSGQRISYWAVHCEACGVCGPEEKTKDEAIEAWSRYVASRSRGGVERIVKTKGRIGK